MKRYKNKARKMPGLGVFAIAVNSFLRGKMGISGGGLIDVLAGILQGSRNNYWEWEKICVQDFKKIISSQKHFLKN